MTADLLRLESPKLRFIPWSAAALTGLLALWGAEAAAADWPQWQGPDRNAISQERGLLQEWPAGGPALAWRHEGLGGGYSTPAVAGGRLFGLSNRGEDEVVWALSEADGKELWAVRIGPALREGPPQGVEGPGSTPTVDGDRLFALGAGGDLVCLETGDGKVVWQVNLMRDFGGRLPMWRYNESPLVDGDNVIVTPGAEDATMVALDKQTGQLVWKNKVTGEATDASGPGPGPGPGGPGGPGGRGRGPGGGRGRGGFGFGPQSGAGYSSAIALDFAGQRQYVQLTAKTLVGVAAKDGKVLWQYDRPANRMGINCSTPLHLGDQVFAASAYGTGGGLVKLNGTAEGVEAEEVYFTPKMQNHHGGMVVVDGAMYGANGGNGGGFLVCLDFQSGDMLWSERGVPKGSIALADGRLYYRTEEGAVLLIEPSKERLIERGRFEQPDRTSSPAWSHPVIANGKLYIRDQDTLYSYNVKAG